MKLWDVQVGQEAGALESKCGRMLALTFTPDGKTLIAGGDEGPMLAIWRAPG